MLSTEHEALEIYITERYFEENKTPADLVEAIANFCAIDDRNSLLLTVALTESVQKIEQWYQRHGIPALNLEDDLSDDVSDVDDLDPRKRTANLRRRTYKTLVLKADLVRMFVPVASITGTYPHGTAAGHERADSTKGLFSIGDFGTLSAGDLYVEDDDGFDSKSIASKAESTWSGTTIGSDSKRRSIRSAGTMIRRGIFGRPLVRGVVESNLDLEYIGQKKVSQELDRMLGTGYDPTTHWTSHLRTRDGNKPFAPDRNSDGKVKMYANFTITDETKLFTRYLAQGYPATAKWIVRPPLYHLDVKTTAGDLNSEFSFSNSQIKMARNYSIPNQEDAGIPTNVYILVRAFNAGIKVDLQFLLDPWSLYLTDKLHLKAEREYRARTPGNS